MWKYARYNENSEEFATTTANIKGVWYDPYVLGRMIGNRGVDVLLLDRPGRSVENYMLERGVDME